MTTTGDGTSIRTFGSEGDPAVLVLHPWWGVTPAVIEWAEAIAGAGRHVLLLGLYGGNLATTVDEAEAIEGSLDYEAAYATVGELADQLASSGRPWAVMGWSMGAYIGCTLAGRHHATPADFVLFYGAQLPRGDVTGSRVSLHVAPIDEFFTEEERVQTEQAFRDAGADVTVHVYEGARHWFAERGSPAFDQAAFEQARERVITQLRP